MRQEEINLNIVREAALVAATEVMGEPLVLELQAVDGERVVKVLPTAPKESFQGAGLVTLLLNITLII